MKRFSGIPIATHLKGEFVLQLVATTPCEKVSLRGTISNVFIVLAALSEEKELHFNVSQNIETNHLIIESSDE